MSANIMALLVDKRAAESYNVKNHLKNYLKPSQYISMYVHSRNPYLFSCNDIRIYCCNIYLFDGFT
jgi:hypothetical protein